MNKRREDNHTLDFNCSFSCFNGLIVFSECFERKLEITSRFAEPQARE